MSPGAPAPCGILLLDKPRGLSSNAALQRVRTHLGRPKAGHTGSLDPLATGMLPICIGEATKLAGELLSGTKAYTVELRLGARTETGDEEGQVVERCSVPTLNPESIESALQGLRGAQQQVPPMYSALKQDGVPLYRLARQGVSVERAARSIEIYALELLGFADDLVKLRVECSKGTYVRTLVEQVGIGLGSCAHVSTLRRDFVEPFRNEAMVSLDALLQTPAPALIPADRAVAQLPELHLNAAQARAICFGQAALIAGAPLGRFRLYEEAGRFMGLGASAESGQVCALRLFALDRRDRN
ncbi:MAG TPA: tRNA pseudouridine(55) synthase TruB [Steroidobacteraceae bacterium]|nr:tRNA pseudouridine(55) synthase TruB [Steroidobacteraceae bacterium]